MLAFSFIFSKVFKKPVCIGFPTAVSIEPISVCNLSCSECPTGVDVLKRPKGEISLFSYKTIIEQIKEKTIMVNLYFQGEPFLHSDLVGIIKYSKEKGLIVSTSTNGHFIDEDKALDIVKSGLDEIYISLDGVDQKVYEKYRVGGNVEVVIESIKNLVNAKRLCKSSFPIIRVQMLVFSFNEHQVDSFKKLSDGLGVDVADVKTAQIYDVDSKSCMLPRLAKYSRYTKGSDGNFKVKGVTKNSCWKHWSSCVITWDGKVVPCCFDKDAMHTFGNALDYPLVDIWGCNKYDRFRKLVYTRQGKIEICKNCPLSRG